MNVLEFLKQNNAVAFEDVAKLLRNPPYNIKVKDRGNLYSLTYDMIGSDLSIPLVQECRGLFLRKGTNRIVAKGFTKFFNAREGKSCLSVLDRSSLRYLEKLDGSLIKLYWDDERSSWVFGTNNLPLAKDAQVVEVMGESSATFDDLIREARGYDIVFEYLDKHWTYCFELIHPRQRIVVDYKGAKRLVFLGSVNVDSMEERDERSREQLGLPSWIETPKEFEFANIDDAMEAAHNLGSDQEGWIVVDKHFNRVKIKGDTYVLMHHTGSKQTLTDAEAVKIVCSGEIDEVCAYSPKFRPLLDLWMNALDTLVSKLIQSWKSVADVSAECRISGNTKNLALKCRSENSQHMSVLLTIHKHVISQDSGFVITPHTMKGMLINSQIMNQKSLVNMLQLVSHETR